MRLSRKENQKITRERLRTAAAREFAQRGVSAASIDAIAEAAGFSRGAFYANYRCKHDLLLEILEAVQKQELTAWQDMVQHAGTLEDALPALAARFDAFLAAETGGLLPIELRLEAQRNPEFGSHYEASRAEVFELSLGLVRALLRKAGASEDEVVALALALRAMATGLDFDTDHRTQGAPSRGEIMALFVKRMMGARGRATGGCSKA